MNDVDRARRIDLLSKTMYEYLEYFLTNDVKNISKYFDWPLTFFTGEKFTEMAEWTYKLDKDYKTSKGVQFNVVDINEERIASWNNKDLSKLPVFEPGLQELIAKTRNKNLFFSTNIKEAIESADIIFISVNTPTKTKGLGAGKSSDLKWVEASAREVARYSKGHTIVVEKSTLPVRTAEVIEKILNSEETNYQKQKISFSVLSNPEFLAEGTAIKDLENPDNSISKGILRTPNGGIGETSLSFSFRVWLESNSIVRSRNQRLVVFKIGKANKILFSSGSNRSGWVISSLSLIHI